MLKNLYSKLTGDPNKKELDRLQPNVEKINTLEPALQKLSDAELRAKTDAFKSQIVEATESDRARVSELREQVSQATDADDRRMIEEQFKQAEKALVDAERQVLDDILPEAFACVREASVRTIGLRHFDVQLIGGMVLHEGKVAEMKTGEGKTLVATLPLYLNALAGHGVHLVTVNDYLARLHAQLMGPVYHALGLSVGALQTGEKKGLIFDPGFKAQTEELNFLRQCPRREAYYADITYGTNSEFGFDYLRDNMAWRSEDRAQREPYFAIVDEVDNILIDEARTPLIISGPAGDPSEEYYHLAEVVRKLAPDDYTIEQRTRGITLTEAGYDRVEQLIGTPLYNPDRPEESDPQQAKVMHHLEAALKAEYMFQRDKDYIVRKGQVIIVDEFTGRLMPGRRWSDGLHQAVEAKERVTIQQESVTYATVTLQNYFRLYQRLAGMTGTAKTEEDEFYKVYGLTVVVIPTNKPMIREDQSDLIYRTEEAKWRAVVAEIASLYAKGQPVLVGTTSVENSERLSERLSTAKIQLYVRARLLAKALDADSEMDDKQRTALKAFLSRRLDDAPDSYEENLSSRLFHEYDLDSVINATRKIPVRDLQSVKKRLAARSGKEGSNVAQQLKLNDKDIREITALNERDVRFAMWLTDRNLRLDGARSLCDEIALHPDDLTKTAPRFNLSLETITAVYQELRLSRDEVSNVNRALIEQAGDIAAVMDEYRIRAADMDIILNRLHLRDEDVARLARKLKVNVDPLAEENAGAVREILAIDDAAQASVILRDGIQHSVLNAKEHAREAHVIARAGELRTVTVSTSMAGRGVDIKLGGELREDTVSEVNRVLRREGFDPFNISFDERLAALEKIPADKYYLYANHVEAFKKYMHDRAQVREHGGLRIIATERHEARRIDNQLRGRSGRQGDSGSSRFYVSLEDEIMRRMGSKDIFDRLDKLGGRGLVSQIWSDEMPLEHDWVTRSIEQAQIKMEGYNFDIRKHLLEYDDVLNKQREIIYGQRNRILTKADLRDDLRGWLEEQIKQILATEEKGDHAEARLLQYLDNLLPGFFMNESEMWAPFSLALVQQILGQVVEPDELDEGAVSAQILDAAKRAMEAHRDYITQAIVPDVVNQFEQHAKAAWDEIEDLAKNTLSTLRDEAQEQNRALDARTMAQAVGQAVRMPLDVRAERGAEISERMILDATRQAFDRRVVEQVVYRVAKWAGLSFELTWQPDGKLEFNELRAELVPVIEAAYTKQAEKYLVDIQRELDDRIKKFVALEKKEQETGSVRSKQEVRRARIAHILFGVSHTMRPAFDQRTHRRRDILVARFPWVYLAAEQINAGDKENLQAQILDYWTQSLAQIEALRGGAQAFNDMLRELMLSVVTNLWVDYLTEIEALREGIGLQAYGQRDPLVEYKRRAFEMFQDLYARIRSQVATFIFTYQYRGLARLEESDRDRVSRQAIEAPAEEAVVVGQPTAKGETRAARAEPARKPVGASANAKLGRNDPCWCGSGKKYKNCHMQSDLR